MGAFTIGTRVFTLGTKQYGRIKLMKKHPQNDKIYVYLIGFDDTSPSKLYFANEVIKVRQ